MDLSADELFLEMRVCFRVGLGFQSTVGSEIFPKNRRFWFISLIRGHIHTYI